MTSFTIISPESLAEAQAILREHPRPRVLGGGTLLHRDLARSGAPDTLLDLSKIPVAQTCRPGQLGAAVTMARICASEPGGLAAAAYSVGNGDNDVRARATLGGNCAPEVRGCAYLVLLALGATGIVLTADGPRKQLLSRHNVAAQGLPLLGVQFRPAPVAFARVEAEPRAPLPLCALAVRAGEDPLTCAIGYAVASPRLITLRRDNPWQDLRAYITAERRDTAEECLRRVLDDLRRSEKT
jgi:FAD binding domain in molybdopterin dehydrogenase